jgi:hypothetical protein
MYRWVGVFDIGVYAIWCGFDERFKRFNDISISVYVSHGRLVNRISIVLLLLVFAVVLEPYSGLAKGKIIVRWGEEGATRLYSVSGDPHLMGEKERQSWLLHDRN